ncbi:unnamed protein product [Urochloa humidicola]
MASPARSIPPPPRTHGVAAAAGRPHQRRPGGDLPPGRVPRRPRPRLRRLIANPNFLRRFPSRHPPLLLGFLGNGHEVFQPVKAPHPNAPVARALGRAGAFSFDYLPGCAKPGWSLCDVSDGRLLLEGSPVHGNDVHSFDWPDLAVCDPVSRQYLLLPRMPEDLLDSVQIEGRGTYDFDDSLVPSGDWEEASFRVMRMIQSRTSLVVLVFSFNLCLLECWRIYQLGCSELPHTTKTTRVGEAPICIWLLLP